MSMRFVFMPAASGRAVSVRAVSVRAERTLCAGSVSVRHWLGAALLILGAAGGAAALLLADMGESEGLEHAESAALDSLYTRMVELEVSNRQLAAELVRARRELAGLEGQELPARGVERFRD